MDVREEYGYLSRCKQQTLVGHGTKPCAMEKPIKLTKINMLKMLTIVHFAKLWIQMHVNLEYITTLTFPTRARIRRPQNFLSFLGKAHFLSLGNEFIIPSHDYCNFLLTGPQP